MSGNTQIVPSSRPILCPGGKLDRLASPFAGDDIRQMSIPTDQCDLFLSVIAMPIICGRDRSIGVVQKFADG